MGHHKHEACKSRAKSKFKFMLNDENAEGNPLFMTEYWKNVIRKKNENASEFPRDYVTGSLQSDE